MLNANSVVNGTNVMIYLTNGATLDITRRFHAEHVGPDDGDHAGLLFFGDRTQPSPTKR